MWPLSLIPAPYQLLIKIALPILVVLGSYGVGYWKGSSHQKTITITRQVQHTVQQIKYVEKVEAPKETVQLESSKKTHDNAAARLPVVTPPPVPNCPTGAWGADTISLLNSQRGVFPKP